MYVSQISGLNSPNYIRTQKKSAVKAQNPNFRSNYSNAFGEVLHKRFQNTNELGRAIAGLFEKLEAAPKAERFSSLYPGRLITESRNAEELFDAMFGEYGLGDWVKNGNPKGLFRNYEHRAETLAWATKLSDEGHQEIGLFDFGGERFMKLEKLDNGNYLFERYLGSQTMDSSEYRNGYLYKQSSVKDGHEVNNTVYNSDGSVNEGRSTVENLLDKIGRLFS